MQKSYKIYKTNRNKIYKQTHLPKDWHERQYESLNSAQCSLYLRNFRIEILNRIERSKQYLGGEGLTGVSSVRCWNHKVQHLRFGEIRQWKFHLQLSDPYRWRKVKVFVVAFYNFKPSFRQVTDFTVKRRCVFGQDPIVKWFLYL